MVHAQVVAQLVSENGSVSVQVASGIVHLVDAVAIGLLADRPDRGVANSSTSEVLVAEQVGAIVLDADDPGCVLVGPPLRQVVVEVRLLDPAGGSGPGHVERIGIDPELLPCHHELPIPAEARFCGSKPLLSIIDQGQRIFAHVFYIAESRVVGPFVVTGKVQLQVIRVWVLLSRPPTPLRRAWKRDGGAARAMVMVMVVVVIVIGAFDGPGEVADKVVLYTARGLSDDLGQAGLFFGAVDDMQGILVDLLDAC
jgi:hypothetical protein